MACSSQLDRSHAAMGVNAFWSVVGFWLQSGAYALSTWPITTCWLRQSSIGFEHACARGALSIIDAKCCATNSTG